jgi:hypothetical protein
MPEQQPTNDEGKEPKGLPEVRAALDRETERRKAAEAEAETGRKAQRDLVFMRAGVDTTTPMGGMFAKGYDGELEVEAVKASYGTLVPAPAEEAPEGEQTPATPGSPQTPQEVQEAEAKRLADARAAIQSGATPPGKEPKGPVGQAMMDAAFEAQQGARARPQGGFGPKARDAAFDVVFQRAKEGDPAAVFKRSDETWADATERWRQSQ